MPHVSPKNVEVWAVDKLKPYANNARKHSDEQVERIAKSIVAYGFNNPILVDSDQGILAGHGRLAAAKSLGLTEVPVIVLDHLSEKDRRAYILADNRLAELAQWDDSVLSQELEALGAGGVDLDALGWDVEELDDLAQELEEIVVNVLQDGSISVGGAVVDEEGLRTALRQAAATDPQVQVTIRGDRRTHHENIVKVMNACGAAGLGNLAVSVLERD